MKCEGDDASRYSLASYIPPALQSGSVTASDLRALIEELKSRGGSGFGIALEEEVAVLGCKTGPEPDRSHDHPMLFSRCCWQLLPKIVREAVKANDAVVFGRCSRRHNPHFSRIRWAPRLLHDAPWNGYHQIVRLLL